MQLFFNMIVPFTICGVALYGAFHRVDVYSSLVQGAGRACLLWSASSPLWWG